MGDYSVQPFAHPDNGGSASRLKMHTIGSRIATQRRRPISLMGRKIKPKQKQQAMNKTDNQVESISHDNIRHETSQVLLNTTSLCNKYQPKLFQEIVGHGVIVKTLSNAIQKKKIAPLYLFHGPNGTGKTSIAKVFAMALNCESTFHNTKPCCSCKGCSRSLYTMDLYSANSISGFEKIKTLLHNTSFAHAIPGMKVFIIEECHLLTVDVWDELMRLVEGPYASNLVFLLITSTDHANSITGNISSRCHKFYFRKLSDEDVAEKLSRIVVHERMVIEKEALKLIVAKSDGSLRDAENILDQLALLGTTINTSIAQQLVGLIPESKLLELLAVAISGDTINTIRYAKKLSESVEPASFVSQLANLITNILSGSQVLDSSSSHAQRSRSQLSKTQSARLCYIFKLLVETERQLRSSNDQTSSIIAAFLDIASVKKASSRIPMRSSSSNETTRQPHTSVEHQRHHDQEKSSRGSLSDMENLWKDVLKGIESSHTQKFLQDQAKLALLCISRINAIVHLTFTRQEDKVAADISEESLSKALEVAIGCPVSLHMSLEQDGKSRTPSESYPLAFGYSDPNRNTGQSSTVTEGLRLTKSKSCSTSQRPHRYSSKGRDLNTVQLQNLTRMFENPTAEYHLTTKDSQRTELAQAGYSKHATQNTRPNRPRHRWLSLSSIPQSDASVEPYSQDVIYENTNKDGDDTVKKNPKFQTGFSKTSKDRRFREPPADQLKSNLVRSSFDICC